MKVTFYGVRGSIPAPGCDTSRFGGNTTCAEVITTGGYRMIIDCGTGIRKLGLKLLKEKDPVTIHLYHPCTLGSCPGTAVLPSHISAQVQTDVRQR